MDERDRLARLVAIGVAGVALVLLALWLSQRMSGSAEAPLQPPLVTTAAVVGESRDEGEAGARVHTDGALAKLEARRAELAERRFELVRALVQEQLEKGEYEELVIRRGDPVPSGNGLHAHNQIAPHPDDPEKQLVKRVSLAPELTREHAAINEELEALDERIGQLRR